MPEANASMQNAVALAYHSGDAAPRVVAKGGGLIAQEIIRRAREAGVYVHESRELVAMLMHVDLDQHIPPALYVVVAELLAWLYRTERRRDTDGQILSPPSQQLSGVTAPQAKPALNA